MARKAFNARPRLSKQHGLNPTMSICFFCGEPKEILLLGKLKGDAKAPGKVLADYQPCKACMEKIAKGRLVVEVVTTDTGSVPIAEGAWPTGRWCVITKEAGNRLFKGNQAMLLEHPMYEELLKHNRRVAQEE